GDARRRADFGLRIEALREFRRRGRAGAQSYGADANGCQRVDQAAGQFRRLLRIDARDDDIDMAGVLLAMAYPDRVGLARAAGSHRYLLASGRGAKLHEKEARRPAMLVAASLDAGEGEGQIYLAADIEPDALRRHLGWHVRAQDVVRWDAAE